MMDLLKMIESGNAATGGLRRVASCFGIVGFVKFLEGFYMILVTKRSSVALIGGHYVYRIDDTLILGITGQSERFDRRSNDEARYIQSFCQVDLTKNFYFSYTYDITNSLQQNMTCSSPKVNTMFIWNHFLLQNGFQTLDNNPWCLPIIFGFVDQAKIPVFGCDVYLTLIARRSRYFAGARFLKRGVNDEGFVANEVETEQIVHDANTTLFEIPHSLRTNGEYPAFTSFLQHRGSIPLYWSQETSQLTPKPPIELNYIDPYHSATALHFSNLFERYGTPLIILNLIKSKEKTPREGILLPEFRDSVTYLNTHLPEDMKMRYVEWDMARANKSDDPLEVVGILERIAEESLSVTGFFHAGREPYLNAVKRAEAELGTSAINPQTEATRILARLQTGITRTNCIDCLDRTNAAQFMLGKTALAHQLYSLGILSSPTNVPFDSDASNLLNSMYQDHGDTIALQYGGSHLVNTMETYRKIGHWTSHSRDMIESIRRYYSNSFTDAEKQDAINLFLGNFVPEVGGEMMWDLPSDYYLHHNPDPLPKSRKRSYKAWWIDTSVCSSGDAVATAAVASLPLSELPKTMKELFPLKADPDQAFKEYYRVGSITSFDRLYPSNMNRGGGTNGSGVSNAVGTVPASGNSILKPEDSRTFDLSPFAVRNPCGGVTVDVEDDEVPEVSPHGYVQGGLIIYGIGQDGILKWLKGGKGVLNQKDDLNPAVGKAEQATHQPQQQQPLPWWTTSALSMRLLDPQVSSGEMKEYKRYVAQFKPPPVSTTKIPKLSTSKRSATEAASRHHPDYEIFQNHVQSSIPKANTSKPDTIDARDEEIYRYYANQSGKVSTYLRASDVAGMSVGVDGTSESEEARYEAYTQWLATGKYHL
ncbi:UNVERIFIED_CONTAM: phosphatidylinositol-3,5-bisphosphate 5-phosphatase [Siphonaria sp. JEL0065]|nr:phosphatidylinositol-3,5-bisphosphate 5-phosphatase [Siphonaria sp. JEL0065]